MRKLFYVPIIHSEADMGSLAEALKKEFINRFGLEKWKIHIKAIDDMWHGIEERLNRLNLDYKRLKIFQDGLPICGKELEIVKEVAKLGSHNHKIVLGLIEKGAHLEGTESAELLIKEYNFIKELTQIKDPKKKKKAIKDAQKARDELLKKRDNFIAKRISGSLVDGDIGLLFAGIEHGVDKFLPKDIQVSYIIYRLPFKTAKLA